MANKTKPAPGWWAVPHTVGNDRRLYDIPQDQVLSCLGLMIATQGWAIAFESPIISDAELSRHAVVGSASTKTVLKAASLLIEAGIWKRLEDGTIDCGAEDDIQAKLDRQKRSAAGGKSRWEIEAERQRQNEVTPEESQETPF